MNNPYCNCTPEPPQTWIKGVCVKCWTWVYNPALRRERPRSAVPRSAPKSAPAPKCRHLGDELPSREAVELGLGSVRRYSLCAVGETKNAKKLPGYVCNCGGCGPRCEKYEPTEAEEQS